MTNQTQKKLLDFFSKFKLQDFKKGHILLQPEDQISNIFFLKNGLVKQYIISEEGEEILVNLFRPGSFIPIMVVLSKTENRHFFEAQTELEAFQAPTNQVLEFLRLEPEVLFDLTCRFAKAINGLSLKIEEITSKNSQEKVISLISYLAEKFGRKTTGGILIDLTLTHQDIANWTNMTRETASRAIAKLTREGLIKTSGHNLVLVSQVTDNN